MPEANKLRFGIIGCGGAAMPVADALAASPVAALAAAYDLNPALARDVAERFGARAHDTLEALLAEHGFAAAFTTKTRLRHVDPFYIGRLDGEELAAVTPGDGHA